MITIEQLETHLFQFEEIRVIFRVPKSRTVPEYPFKNRLGDSQYVEALRDRINANYAGFDFEIIDGNGLIITSKVLRTNKLRDTYLNKM